MQSPASRQQLLASSLTKQAMQPRNIQSPMQGYAQLAQALFGGLNQRKADQMFQTEQTDNATNLATMLSGAGFTPGESDLFASTIPGARDAGSAQFAARRARELEELKAGNRPPKYENVVRNGVPTRMTPLQQEAAIAAGNKIAPFSSPGTVVNVAPDARNPGDDELAKGTAKIINNEQEQLVDDQNIMFRLDQMSELLDPARELETGAVTAMLMPVRGILRDLNLMSAEDTRNFDDQQIFTAAANYIVPRMRVAGSGASSDFEQRLFASATAGLGNTPEANRVLVSGMRALYGNKRRIAQARAQFYRDNNGNMTGFEKSLEENHVPLFRYVDSDKSRKNSVNETEFLDAINAGEVGFGDLYYHAQSKQFRVLSQQDLTELQAEFGE